MNPRFDKIKNVTLASAGSISRPWTKDFTSTTSVTLTSNGPSKFMSNLEVGPHCNISTTVSPNYPRRLNACFDGFTPLWSLTDSHCNTKTGTPLSSEIWTKTGMVLMIFRLGIWWHPLPTRTLLRTITSHRNTDPKAANKPTKTTRQRRRTCEHHRS